MSKKLLLLSITIISVVVLLTYAPATRLNFYGDDYSFLEIAGRSSLPQYLASYFDPRLQTGWYRPMQGMLFGLEWVMFGGNPLGYHVVNVLVHLANCILLFALVWRLLKRWHVTIIATLVYAGLPLYGVAVFWPGDADFLMTFFYLLSIFFWVLHLQKRKRIWYVAAFVSFLLTLLTKEFGVTLPVLLVCVDRLLLREEIGAAALLRRYTPFLFVWLIYLPLEYYVQSRSVLTNMYGYGLGNHTISNFLQYLTWLAFPWGLPEPANYIWLVAAVALFLFILFTKRSAPLLFLGIASVLAFLPAINFPWFFTRYLYMAVMASAVILALLFDLARDRLGKRPSFAPSAFALIALIVFGNALGTAENTADFAELGRQTRVPFRDIAQRHSTFPDDTYLYFVDPPTITSQLSGMFFLRYGAGVRVESNGTGGHRANLRDHNNAYVIYFDEQRRTREMTVDKAMSVETQPPVPVDFSAPVRLVGYEMPSAKAKRGDAFVLILYWQVTGKIAGDYAISVRLVDAATNRVVVGSDAEPRGGSPMSSWKPNELIVDVVVLPISKDAPAGSNYRLEIGLYDSVASARVPLSSATGDSVVMIVSLSVIE